jgi:hypothetical protein
LILVNGGLVILTADAMGNASSANNRVVHISETGQLLHASTLPFALPSSVAFEVSPNWGALYVTERGNAFFPVAGQVSEFIQGWNLQPRP